MSNISEHRIEQFIRFPEELSEKDKSEIKTLIQTSEEAKKIYNFLTGYYEELDKVQKTEIYVIPLKAKSFVPDYSGPVVLAAMTSDTASPSLITKATLVSEKHKTLVRVLKNQHDQTLQFHVVGSSDRQSEYAILSILQPEIDLVTNETGKLKGVRELSDLNWKSVPSVLRLPRQKIKLDPSNPGAPVSIKPNTTAEIHIEMESDIISVAFASDHSIYSRILAIQGEKSDLIVIDRPELDINITSKEEIMLYFYE